MMANDDRKRKADVHMKAAIDIAEQDVEIGAKSLCHMIVVEMIVQCYATEKRIGSFDRPESGATLKLSVRAYLESQRKSRASSHFI
jgi:hypothetical protein